MSFELIHTSSYAHPQDLARMVKALAPQCLIPIHTFHPRAYDRFGARVIALLNGEWSEI